MKYNTGLVILNYLTYQCTIKSLQSIKQQQWFNKVKIYVVDNGSHNNSVDKLTNFQKIIPFQLLESDKNLGFANGLNIGIKQARENGCHSVICLNNDILFKDQNNFLTEINNTYQQDKSIAVIVPNIKNSIGDNANNIVKNPPSKKRIIKLKIFYKFGLDYLYYYLRIYLLFGLANFIISIIKLTPATDTKQHLQSQYIYIPSGACIILTPAFFNHFEGLDSNTFLFSEESILGAMVAEKNLKCYLNTNINIIHTEAKTISTMNKTKRKYIKFMLKHSFASKRYFVNRYL